MKGEDAEDVCEDQKREDDAGGFAGRHNLGHENHGQQSERTETGFGQPGTNGGQDGKEPGMGGEVGHGYFR